MSSFLVSKYHSDLTFDQCRLSELDTRTRLDRYKYLEVCIVYCNVHSVPNRLQLPSFLFVTFCFAVWLSFFPIAYGNYPRIWPLAWLGLVAFILFNPFRLWFKDSRYWFLKLFGNLFLSGTRRVEVSRFSLMFSPSSDTVTVLGFLACVSYVDIAMRYEANHQSVINSAVLLTRFRVSFILLVRTRSTSTIAIWGSVVINFLHGPFNGR